jgi:hypothetical protein
LTLAFLLMTIGMAQFTDPGLLRKKGAQSMMAMLPDHLLESGASSTCRKRRA